MGLVKVYKALLRLLSGGTLHPPPPVPLLMSTSEDFSVPFHSLIKLCYTKTLKWSSLFPGPKAKSSTLEITNWTPFTLSYHNQANQHVHHFHFCHFPLFLCWELLLVKQTRSTQQYYHIAVHHFSRTYLFILHAAAAAAKSLQLCLTLCDPTDGSPNGSPVPGILQARTLEWVAISFSNVWKWKVNMK